MSTNADLRNDLINFFGDKYTTWSNLTDDNYDELVDAGMEKSCCIRIADHSCRFGNINSDQADVTLSFVVSDENKTDGRFGFDYLLEWNISDMSTEDAKAFIADRIREHFAPVLSTQDKHGSYYSIID